jgi:DNA repair ATPase RecN
MSKRNPKTDIPVDDAIRVMAKDPLILVDRITDLMERYHADYYKVMKARELMTSKGKGKELAKAAKEHKFTIRALKTINRAALKYPGLFTALLIKGDTVRSSAERYEISYQRLSVLRQTANSLMAKYEKTAAEFVKWTGKKAMELPKFVVDKG